MSTDTLRPTNNSSSTIHVDQVEEERLDKRSAERYGEVPETLEPIHFATLPPSLIPEGPDSGTRHYAAQAYRMTRQHAYYPHPDDALVDQYELMGPADRINMARERVHSVRGPNESSVLDYLDAEQTLAVEKKLADTGVHPVLAQNWLTALKNFQLHPHMLDEDWDAESAGSAASSTGDLTMPGDPEWSDVEFVRPRSASESQSGVSTPGSIAPEEYARAKASAKEYKELYMATKARLAEVEARSAKDIQELRRELAAMKRAPAAQPRESKHTRMALAPPPASVAGPSRQKISSWFKKT